MRKKDAEQALLLEEKINLQMQLLHVANIWSGNESSDNERLEKVDKEIPDYTRLVHNEGTDTTQLRQEVNIFFFFIHGSLLTPLFHCNLSINAKIITYNHRWLAQFKKRQSSPALYRLVRVVLPYPEV